MGAKLSWMAVLGEAKVCLDAGAPLLISFHQSYVAVCGTTCTISHSMSNELGQQDWRRPLERHGSKVSSKQVTIDRKGFEEASITVEEAVSLTTVCLDLTFLVVFRGP